VALPDPDPGLVIAYAYLWRDEAKPGCEESAKDRPAVIVLSVTTGGGEKIVTVAPVTHRRPAKERDGIEIPAPTKLRLGMDEAPSWIIASDLNQFVWPGIDLRPIRRGSTEFAYGALPRGLYRLLRDRVLELAKARLLQITPRS
jgi:hypothetical protein